MAIKVLAILLTCLVLNPQGIHGDFQLEPFHLNKKSPEKPGDPILDSDTKIINRGYGNKASDEGDRNMQLAFRSGYPFFFGFIGDKANYAYPAFAMVYRFKWSKDWFFFPEVEFMYLPYESDSSLRKNSINRYHSFPLSFAVGFHLPLYKALTLEPVIGFGYSYLYTMSVDGNLNSSLIFVKSGLRLAYMISDRVSLDLSTSFYLFQDLQVSMFQELDYILVPALGFTYQF